MSNNTHDNPWICAGIDLLPEMIALRRAIHAEPEIGLQTPKTTAKIKQALAGLPLEYIEGPSTSGFIALLRGPIEGKTVLLRGDMDALPLTEDTGQSFTSRHEGIMHACGHDAHVAMLVGAAKALCAKRELIKGSVMFMFQPGEEGDYGARLMLEDGLLNPLPDSALALHIFTNLPSGVFSSRAGAIMAAADIMEITITGKGGHASMPHLAIDPIPIACEIVTNLQMMVTRRIPALDPVVITIGRIHSGTTFNIIPEVATLSGTIRSLSEKSRTLAFEGIERVSTHIANAHNAVAKVQFESGYPVTYCDENAVNLVKTTAQNLFGESGWLTAPYPAMCAEDFSYILQKIPGAMVFLGAAPENSNFQTCHGIHSNQMILDESAMARGVAMHCAYAQAFLNKPQ